VKEEAGRHARLVGMHSSLFHQELARARHADLVREATRRVQLPRAEVVTAAEPRRPRLRLIRPRLALRLVPG
jgi:hypothetical protein